ncbi:hypothetical protein QJQ45_020886 [Haematococcus lacustris]|nr:hypothetical protein QJQ45_020886 [Haematococcus lacustris]
MTGVPCLLYPRCGWSVHEVEWAPMKKLRTGQGAGTMQERRMWQRNQSKIVAIAATVFAAGAAVGVARRVLQARLLRQASAKASQLQTSELSPKAKPDELSIEQPGASSRAVDNTGAPVESCVAQAVEAVVKDAAQAPELPALAGAARQAINSCKEVLSEMTGAPAPPASSPLAQSGNPAPAATTSAFSTAPETIQPAEEEPSPARPSIVAVDPEGVQEGRLPSLSPADRAASEALPVVLPTKSLPAPLAPSAPPPCLVPPTPPARSTSLLSAHSDGSEQQQEQEPEQPEQPGQQEPEQPEQQEQAPEQTEQQQELAELPEQQQEQEPGLAQEQVQAEPAPELGSEGGALLREMARDSPTLPESQPPATMTRSSSRPLPSSSAATSLGSRTESRPLIKSMMRSVQQAASQAVGQAASQAAHQAGKAERAFKSVAVKASGSKAGAKAAMGGKGGGGGGGELAAEPAGPAVEAQAA